MSRNREKESGVALVMVLSLLAFISLLAVSAVSLSQYMTRDAYTGASFSRSAYIAEGAANRIYWYLLNDRKKYPQRNIIPEEDIEEEEERYLADGLPRRLEEFKNQGVTYEIHDAVSGMDVSGKMPHRDLMNLLTNLERNGEERRKLEIYMNRLQDYVDADSIPHLNGREEKEYDADGMPNLPRNGAMQYREELLWVPGTLEYFKPDTHGRMTAARLIAPNGMPPVSGRPSLYSTPLQQIAERCKLSPVETSQLQDAFSAWTRLKMPLKDSLPPGFLKRLELYYGTSESSFYTLLIDASTTKNPGVRLAVTFKVQFGTDVKRQFYEFMFY